MGRKINIDEAIDALEQRLQNLPGAREIKKYWDRKQFENRFINGTPQEAYEYLRESAEKLGTKRYRQFVGILRDPSGAWSDLSDSMSAYFDEAEDIIRREGITGFIKKTLNDNKGDLHYNLPLFAGGGVGLAAGWLLGGAFGDGPLGTVMKWVLALLGGVIGGLAGMRYTGGMSELERPGATLGKRDIDYEGLDNSEEDRLPWENSKFEGIVKPKARYAVDASPSDPQSQPMPWKTAGGHGERARTNSAPLS